MCSNFRGQWLPCWIEHMWSKYIIIMEVLIGKHCYRWSTQTGQEESSISIYKIKTVKKKSLKFPKLQTFKNGVAYCHSKLSKLKRLTRLLLMDVSFNGLDGIGIQNYCECRLNNCLLSFFPSPIQALNIYIDYQLCNKVILPNMGLQSSSQNRQTFIYSPHY